MMIPIGLLIIVLGFAIALFSLLLHSVGGQLLLVLLGIGISLFGIMGVLNKHYLKNAIWKKG